VPASNQADVNADVKDEEGRDLKRFKKNRTLPEDVQRECRYFHSSWLKTHPWAFFNNTTNKIHCLLCQKHGKSNVYADKEKGASTIKLHALDLHSTCEDHKDAVFKEAQKKIVDKKTLARNTPHFIGLHQLFTLAYHVARE
jgi:hypothetical protein